MEQMSLFQCVLMAFMTPVIRPGWDLYNVHPPIKIVRKKRLKNQSGSRGNLESILLHRRHTVNGSGTGSAAQNQPKGSTLHRGRSLFGDRKLSAIPIKSFHANAVALGQYQLQAFSTDSLRQRNLAMQVIPEEGEDDYDQDDCNSEPDTSDGLTTLVASSDKHHRKSKPMHFLQRVRQLFGLVSKSSKKDSAMLTTAKKSAPQFGSSASAHRRRRS